MQQSKPGRIARFSQWRRDQETRVNDEIERRGLPPIRSATDPTLRPPQTARLDAAGWNMLEPKGECARRLAPIDLPEDFPDKHFIELAVHAKEIGWRFGDGDDPITMRAAAKLAAMLQVERENAQCCDMDALQRWFEFEEWQAIGLRASLKRSQRLAAAFDLINDPSTDLRDRGLDRTELSKKFADRWLPTCRVASELLRQVGLRPHVELDDDHLRRMLRLAHGQVGEAGLPKEYLSRTPREQLAFLDEYLSNRKAPSYPLVTRASWGAMRAEVLGLVEALDDLYGRDPEAVGSSQEWRGRFTERRRLNTEVVLARLEMFEAHPDFDSLDAMMFTILVLQRTTERWVYSPPAGSLGEISRRQVVRTHLLAIDGLVRAIVPAGERDRHTRRRILATYISWLGDMSSLIDQGESNASERDQRRVGLFLSAANSVGPQRNPESIRRALRRAMSQLGHSIPRGSEPEYLKMCIEFVRETAAGTWAFPGSNGEIRLGHRQIRDRMAREPGFKRDRRSRPSEGDPNDLAAPPSDALAHKTFEVRDTDQDARAAPADESLNAIEISKVVSTLREIAEHDPSWTKPGSIKSQVFQNFPDIISKSISGRQLAAKYGRKRSYSYFCSNILLLRQRVAMALKRSSPGS